MIEWVLILLVHVGPAGRTDSNSLASVPGFVSEAECQAAGKDAAKLVRMTVKDAAFVCVRRTTR